jgi:hypothetical protein
MARSKKPKDYSKGKIYMVVCRKTGKQYVGSTTKQYLSQRLDTHRSDYKAWLNKTGNYCYSVLVLENEDYYIKLLQLYPCTCNDELRMKEQEYIDANECVNHNKSYRSEEDKKEYTKEYNAEHKEEKKEYYEEHKEEKKEYAEEHKEEIKEYQKVYRETHKEEIKEINKKLYEKNRDKLLEYQKEYREENKELVNKKSKEYRKKNKEILKEKAREKINCVCGCSTTKQHKARHEKTQKHINFINSTQTQ